MAKSKKKKQPTKLELKAKAIAACADKRGRIIPDVVIEVAKNPKSILHEEFEWNIEMAAQQAWRARAKELIREVRFMINDGPLRIAAPYYVSDVTSDESAYVATASIARKHATAKATLEREVTMIKAAVHRAKAIAAVFGLISTFEKMLDLVIEVERDLGDDDDHVDA